MFIVNMFLFKTKSVIQKYFQIIRDLNLCLLSAAYITITYMSLKQSNKITFQLLEYLSFTNMFYLFSHFNISALQMQLK